MVPKEREEREDAIVSRLGQIEAALCDFGTTIHRLRQERLKLWEEYHALIAAELESGSKPPTDTSANS